MTEEGVLSLWVVYDHPIDYPDAYVARLHEVSGQGRQRVTHHVLTADNLTEIRAALAAFGLTRISRSVEDDPVIVETWL